MLKESIISPQWDKVTGFFAKHSKMLWTQQRSVNFYNILLVKLKTLSLFFITTNIHIVINSYVVTTEELQLWAHSHVWDNCCKDEVAGPTAPQPLCSADQW